MPESIPLRATLRVERVEVVVCDARNQRLDAVLEALTTKRRLLGNSERETASGQNVRTSVRCNFSVGPLTPIEPSRP